MVVSFEFNEKQMSPLQHCEGLKTEIVLSMT